MAIISQETWDKFTEEEKEKIREDYRNMINGKTEYTPEERNGAIYQAEWLFGKENLQPKPQIKTWADVEKHKPKMTEEFEMAIKHLASSYTKCDMSLILKCKATLQIQKLIELGYGGMITEEEWKLSSSYISKTAIWSIVCEYKAECKEPQFKVKVNWAQVDLVSFHTKQQAEEFMSYPENVELVKQYYMI